MIIWLIKDGEALPVQENAAKMRVGMLAEALVQAGQQVVWWSSTFLHARKQLYANQDVTLEMAPGYQLKLLYAGSYQRNVSLGRIRHHRRLARRFEQESRQMPTPDLILCCLPTIELANLAVRYGLARRIPVIIDIRDPWPSTFLSVTPPWTHGILRLFLPYFYRQVRFALQHATRVVAMSQDVLQWGLNLAGRQDEPGHQVFYIGYSQTREAPVGSLAPDSAPDWWRDLHSRPNPTIFTFVGTFGMSYNLKLIVDAARALEQEGITDCLFVLAGDGDQSPFLREYADRCPNLLLTGWLSMTQVHALLSVSHFGMVLNTNITEGIFPNKFFLYLANRLPVLTIVRGEMVRVIEQYHIGYTCPEESVAAFCQVIRRILAESATLAAMRERAFRTFVTQFESNQIYQRFAEYLMDVGLSSSGKAGI